MASELSRFHKFIVNAHDLDELYVLCSDIGVRFEDLGGKGLSGKAWELVSYMGRRGRLAELLNTVSRERPAGFDFDLAPAAIEALQRQLPDFEADAILPGQQADGDRIAQSDQARPFREQELAYLDELLARYDYWRDHYTPLAGIAEVRAAVLDGPRLDLPMPFIPPGFERLVEHGYGERVELKREPVDDLREAVDAHRRVVLLGEPGSGKTTTLWRLAYDYALAARDDEGAPLPVLVPLGGYDEGPFDAYLARHLAPLAAHLDAYRASGRLALLLDGLNEMPQVGYAERVGRIRETLGRSEGETVVITCRALDYVVELREFRAELLRAAALPYKPNLNDGVIINAAPLYRLFRLRKWAGEVEKVWGKLEAGDYDWAHMARTLWPERMRELCKRDRSIAIAHGLGEVCEVAEQVPKKKKRGKKKKATGQKELEL